VADIVKEYEEAAHQLDKLGREFDEACRDLDKFLQRHPEVFNRDIADLQRAPLREQPLLQWPTVGVPAAQQQQQQPLGTPTGLGLPSLDHFRQRSTLADPGADPGGGPITTMLMSPGFNNFLNLNNPEPSWVPRDLGNADGGVESQVEMIGGSGRGGVGDLFADEIRQLGEGPGGERPSSSSFVSHL
jgi:hypothetical protein